VFLHPRKPAERLELEYRSSPIDEFCVSNKIPLNPSHALPALLP
jgi:hypothetical protein